jgi:predicted transglutaminase-like cysteine proteinase
VPAAAAELAPPPQFIRVLNFDVDPSLPPIGHSRFCLRYPDDCKVQGIDFRRRSIVLKPERWEQVNLINRKVNREIEAAATPGSGLTEEWLIAPRAGDCKDYAITKRHALLELGWPSRALLLSEVVIPSGEHHLVLVVRVKDVDLVLDNLNTSIRSVAMTYQEYLWVRIETPQNPKFWARMRLPTPFNDHAPEGDAAAPAAIATKMADTSMAIPGGLKASDMTISPPVATNGAVSTTGALTAQQQPAAMEPSTDSLAAAAPIRGPIPLPRRRPRDISAVHMADIAPGNVPVLRPRPDGAGPASPAETSSGSPIDFIQNLFH